MYQGRTFIRESVYVCGNYMDADIYPVFQKPGRRRSRCNPTSEIQKRLNQKNAEKRLTRLVHTNFTEDDIALHLTYRPGEEPETKEGAQRDLQNYIRRLKRRYTKLGKEFKYISCTEYGKKTNRIHHHLIISGGLDRDEIEKLWGRGYANSIRLQFGPDGVTGLAHYIAKDKLFFRHWNQSRNLVQPEPAQYDGKITLDEVGNLVDAIEEKYAWVQLEQRYQALAQLKTALIQKARKYRNEPEMAEGIRFDSKKEAGRFRELQAMLQAGLIRELRLQQDFTLQEAYTTPDGRRIRAIRYCADFCYERKTQNGWEKIVEDVKSRATRTQKYIIKRKMMQDRYGIEIKEI